MIAEHALLLQWETETTQTGDPYKAGTSPAVLKVRERNNLSLMICKACNSRKSLSEKGELQQGEPGTYFDAGLTHWA